MRTGGEVGMIQIDMQMPDNCVECRFNDSGFGYCNAMPVNFCGQVNDYEEDGRPEWCPLKAQEPRVMTIQEIKNADFCYLEVNGHDGVTPVLLKHFIDDKYIHVTINGGSVYFFDITCDVEKLVRCWTSRPTDEQREATLWN
jgi:hypothetical protein